ncbi:hypothetical protein BC936DRAFT_145028 [Jimgerdemannia flammicorona]|uniref:FAD-binding FR-type domain-containing protein n=1 Tax=Jimgerdemannia flammicorona TaxID=994334 RepID=A0A433DB29_9FUNG|nr:hypothetical protein BC936DRAFT_145028 [Jimgerdemannia flammicorona]
MFSFFEPSNNIINWFRIPGLATIVWPQSPIGHREFCSPPEPARVTTQPLLLLKPNLSAINTKVPFPCLDQAWRRSSTKKQTEAPTNPSILMRAVALIAALAALSLTRAPVANAQTMNPRPIDNVGNNPTDVNAGTPNQPFLRLDVPTAYFADDSGTLFPGSTIITNTTTTNTTVYPAFQCLVAPPAPPTQPYPRCVSDLVNGYTATPLGQVTDVGTRSIRRVSHFETAWAQFLEYDIVGPDGQAELINIGIPTDDVAINTGPNGVSAAVLVTSNKSIEFYRRPSSIDPDTKKSDHVGLNFVTGFLDASPVYGSSFRLCRFTISVKENNSHPHAPFLLFTRLIRRDPSDTPRWSWNPWQDEARGSDQQHWRARSSPATRAGRPLYPGQKPVALLQRLHGLTDHHHASRTQPAVRPPVPAPRHLLDRRPILQRGPQVGHCVCAKGHEHGVPRYPPRPPAAALHGVSAGCQAGEAGPVPISRERASADKRRGCVPAEQRERDDCGRDGRACDVHAGNGHGRAREGGVYQLQDECDLGLQSAGVEPDVPWREDRWVESNRATDSWYFHVWRVGDVVPGIDLHYEVGRVMVIVRANGTDITNDLLGLRGDTDGVPKRKLLRQNSVPVQRDRNEKDEFVFASELQQYLAPMDKARLKKSSTQVSGVNSKRANEGFFARLLPGGSVASTIDYVNSSFFQPGEIARHTHSDYAKRKLATMVTARIDNSDDGSAAVLQIPDALAHRKGRESPTGMFISPRPASGLVRTKATMPLTLRPPVTRLQTQFRRFVLIDKTNIAHGEHPVVAFTFAPVHALGEQYSVPTLPGQYVELMSQIRQETVKRPYNVVHGSVNTEFTIYVKIYANGKMSRHLDQDRQVKSEISVRGPFDITRRTPVEDLIWKRPADIDPNVVPRTDSIMLNPERADGRWRHAYAIVGGTGITPILQLIEHYQYIYKEEREQKSKLANSSTPPASDSPNDPPLLTWIHILIANRTVLDVIESAELETVAKHTGNRYLRVTISYVFSEPPEKWQGMKGLLNREKVEEWVRSCQEQAMSSTHNDRDSSTAAGVSGGPSEKSRDSVRKSHTIQDVMPGLGRASQVPAVSVTYAEEEEEEEEVRYKPGEDGSVASITLSRSSTAVGIETISGSLMGPDRQNVVLICGPDRMMENVKSILMEIDVEEIRERSWVITLY